MTEVLEILEFTVPTLRTVHQSIETLRQYFQAEGQPEDLQRVDKFYDTLCHHLNAKKK